MPNKLRRNNLVWRDGRCVYDLDAAPANNTSNATHFHSAILLRFLPIFQLLRASMHGMVRHGCVQLQCSWLWLED